ncbi:hypothetical protein EZS27_025893 [termite gut metagenome]|uniref:Uncharacterized protein n=1 Tax=termite gut metagenome TaxID=433724 RepID=A0A5J4QUL3_9ZZZZ
MGRTTRIIEPINTTFEELTKAAMRPIKGLPQKLKTKSKKEVLKCQGKRQDK